MLHLVRFRIFERFSLIQRRSKTIPASPILLNDKGEMQIQKQIKKTNLQTLHLLRFHPGGEGGLIRFNRGTDPFLRTLHLHQFRPREGQDGLRRFNRKQGALEDVPSCWRISSVD